jgi:hypothetical protein
MFLKFYSHHNSNTTPQTLKYATLCFRVLCYSLVRYLISVTVLDDQVGVHSTVHREHSRENHDTHRHQNHLRLG